MSFQRTMLTLAAGLCLTACGDWSPPGLSLVTSALGSSPSPDTKILEPEGEPPSTSRQVPDEVIVRFRDSASTFSQARSHARLGTRAVREFNSVKGLQLVKLPRDLTPEQAIQALRRDQDVLYAEPNYIVRASATPDDPRFPELWNLHNTGQSGGLADADIDAPEAWELTTGSTGVVVAVIDSGVDYTHPDLSGNMYRNAADCDSDGFDDDGNGSIDDCYGIDTINNDSDPMDDNRHGTHVAGILGASGNNALGVTGVSWRVSILACKSLNASGTGTTASAIACLDYVAAMKDRGVNIVATNNSWGGGPSSQALRDAIARQRERGILFVTSAGNAKTNLEKFGSYPCSYSHELQNILCVSSTNTRDYPSIFSNSGRRTVHLAAPGEKILSTIPVAMGSYASLDGTSMATPQVTGAVALMHALNPGSHWLTVKNRILAGADATDYNTAIGPPTITARRLNVHRALTCDNARLLSRVRPVAYYTMVAVGVPIPIAALHLNCGVPNGDVTVDVMPSEETVTLRDDGLGNDAMAGDGIYSGAWIPTEGGLFTLRVRGESIDDPFNVDVDPDLQPGFPVESYAGGGTYMGGPVVHTLVANIDGEPGLEIIASAQALGPLYAWDATGKLMPGWPVFTGGFAYPGAGQLSPASPGNELVTATYGAGGDGLGLRAYTGMGTLLPPGWPVFPTQGYQSPPSLSDVDGDGLDEVFMGDSFNWPQQLLALRAGGDPLPGWPVPLSSSQSKSFPPAIADLDGDAHPEIIYIDRDSYTRIDRLYARRANGTLLAGFPLSFSKIYAPPVVGDVDGDGAPEIVVGASLATDTGTQFKLVDASGTIKGSIPFENMSGVPALADLDGDGAQEIIFQTEWLDSYYASFRSGIDVLRGTGEHYPGWPIIWSGSFWTGNSSPVVGDVDGDGLPEIVVTSQYAGSITGMVRVHRRDGTSHPRFPKTRSIGAGAVPAIADIDGDGRNEIIITGNGWYGEADFLDKVWVYDLGGPAHGPVLWGQYMGNAKHTGTAVPNSAPPATFYTLTASKTGNGGVKSAPSGIDCGSDCSEPYVSGTSLTLTATPASGHRLNGWTGACSGSGLTCTVVLDAHKSAAAEFVPIRYDLTLSTAGSGSGAVTSTPAGINCGTTCTAVFNSGTQVTLTASASSGSIFAGWGGACSGGSTTCHVMMSSTRAVTASFILNTRNLSVSRTGAGTGTISSTPAGINCGAACLAAFAFGSTVTLTASASGGSAFAGWSGACSGQGATCTVRMDSASFASAQFNPIPQYLLSVSRTGSGSGTVTSTPAGINCGATCSATYNSGTSVTLTASASFDSLFAGWSGACSGQGTTCTVLMDSARSVSALFSLIQYPLTVSRTGSGSGTVSSDTGGIHCGDTCAATYDVGTSVTLTAIAASGATFVGWSEACYGQGNPCTVRMDEARSVTARFDTMTYALSVTRTGASDGTVSSMPVGIDCGTACSAMYTSGTAVTLTASSSGGATFTGWSGACSGQVTTCTVLMDGARSVSARFDPVEAPPAPVVTAPASLVNTATPVIAGTARAGSLVTVSLDGVAVGTVTADPLGAWSFSPATALQEGEHTATARAADAAGNASPSSAARIFTVDTIAPLSPTVVAPAEGAVLMVATPAFSGGAEVGSTVKVWVDDTEAGTVTADPAGAWSFTPSAPLADGPHTVRAAATDSAGNTSPVSASRSFTVETARGCGCAGAPTSSSTGPWWLLLFGLWAVAPSRATSPSCLRKGRAPHPPACSRVPGTEWAASRESGW